MTEGISAEAEAALREMVEQWVKEHVRARSVEHAEEVAIRASRLVGHSVVQRAVGGLGREKSSAGASLPCACGERARFVGYRGRWIRTKAGEARVERAYYSCAHCHRSQTPFDEEQGLNGRQLSPGLKALCAFLCGRLPYGEVSEVLEETLGVGVEESVLHQATGEVGVRLRLVENDEVAACFERRESTPEPKEAPERLYISVDAVKAHTGGDWHDVKVGAISEARRQAEGDRLFRTRHVAAEEAAEAYGKRLYVRARALGAEQALSLVALGDGAVWIWVLMAYHFPRAVQILDYWHACEHIWTLAKVLYGEGSPAGERWAKTHCRRLKEKGPGSLLRALSRRKPATELQKEALRKELGYFKSHRKRMRYPAYRKAGMIIGSGAVEAGCKVVVTQRMKQAGMRWGTEGSDAMLAVRTTLLNQDRELLARCARAA